MDLPVLERQDNVPQEQVIMEMTKKWYSHSIINKCRVCLSFS